MICSCSSSGASADLRAQFSYATTWHHLEFELLGPNLEWGGGNFPQPEILHVRLTFNRSINIFPESERRDSGYIFQIFFYGLRGHV